MNHGCEHCKPLLAWTFSQKTLLICCCFCQVDKVLLEHPEVAEAATFAVPDVVLGQAPQAAVMLREGSSMSKADVPHQLRRFMTTRLHKSKVGSIWNMKTKAQASVCASSIIPNHHEV